MKKGCESRDTVTEHESVSSNLYVYRNDGEHTM